jgi:DNA helicase-2/ATP-dependent DNA helicase PcrA
VFDTASAEQLNDAQRRAVEHEGGPLLIVAGAGTGKTKTLAARVGRLLDTGVPAERILLLTFSRRAAQEMLARVAAGGGSGGGASRGRAAAPRVWGGTFHATANRLLRRFGGTLGLGPSFTVLDQGDATELFGLVRSELGLAARGSRFPKADTVAAVYSRVVNTQSPMRGVLHDSFPWCAEHVDGIRDCFVAYTERKRRNNVLDYDDLLLHWRALLAAPELRDTVRGLFDHVLVDEYQDTNVLQADIVRGLCPPAQLTAVGDDAQAIYGFRAASADNMWRFAEHFPGATTITLEENYRSTAPILDVANAVLAQSPAHLPKALRAVRPGGVRPRLTICHDEAAQSALVCDTVLELREQGIDLRRQAVLFRAGHHSAALELELARRDIPFVKYGGLKFLEAAHIKDLLALLRVLDNPTDELAWHRALGMLEGVGPATVRRLCDELGVGRSGTDPLATFLTCAVRVPAAAEAHLSLLRDAWAACAPFDLEASHAGPAAGGTGSTGAASGPGRVATGAEIDDTGTSGGGPAVDIDALLPLCRAVFPGRYDDATVRLNDLESLRVAAQGHRSRSRFLAELTLDPPDRTSDLADSPHLDDDWLTLSTIHSAKGLEWPAVHLIHAADGNIPSDMALADKAGIEEERRLLYVALTRARDQLFVSMPQRFHVKRFGSDDRHLLAPLSRFLEPVRDRFDQQGTAQAPHGAPVIDLRVNLTDEVDALLHSLWD